MKDNLSESKINMDINNPSLINPPIESIEPTELDVMKEYLIFDYKIVSPFKLYYYISDKIDIFLIFF